MKQLVFWLIRMFIHQRGMTIFLCHGTFSLHSIINLSRPAFAFGIASITSRNSFLLAHVVWTKDKQYKNISILQIQTMWRICIWRSKNLWVCHFANRFSFQMVSKQKITSETTFFACSPSCIGAIPCAWSTLIRRNEFQELAQTADQKRLHCNFQQLLFLKCKWEFKKILF